MVIALNGLGWQTAVQQHNRTNNEQALSQFVPVRQVAATRDTAAQQNSQGSTSQQSSEDNQKEAFAKLLVMLQNPDSAARQQASVGKQEQSSAAQDFHDYMAKSPEEKIKEKMLQELGLTEDEYQALPPEQKAAIDDQIAQRMKEDVELKTQAKLQQAQQAQQAQQVSSGLAVAASGAEDSEKQKAAEL
ncbi:hypothetical protein [Pseudomonas xanthosomatis]|uniref:hypothetical protein n=1 Tax=Pseudomonas xanthosomatis TaxID=2842356 RepID=UPI003518ED6C